MSRKPMIAMNMDYRPSRHDSISLSWLNSGYYEAISRTNGLPVAMPPYAEDEDLRQILSQMDGLVMIGCKLDLDPIPLGMDLHPATRVMPKLREDYDRRLARIAYDLKIPTLAIGSGMQMMNLVCGGTLYQHVEEEHPGSLHHRDVIERNVRHILEIVPGSRFDTMYGPGEIRVNSDHHMAIDHLAPVFRVSATSPDGVIEAYETIDDDWYCIGTQFHPESETASALDMQVIEAFMEACEQPEPAILKMGSKQAA